MLRHGSSYTLGSENETSDVLVPNRLTRVAAMAISLVHQFWLTRPTIRIVCLPSKPLQAVARVSDESSNSIPNIPSRFLDLCSQVLVRRCPLLGEHELQIGAVEGPHPGVGKKLYEASAEEVAPDGNVLGSPVGGGGGDGAVEGGQRDLVGESSVDAVEWEER